MPCSRGADSEILGSQLHELVEQRREVGATKRIAAANEERARPTGGGTPGAEDVGCGELFAAAGLRLTRVVPTAGAAFVLEAST